MFYEAFLVGHSVWAPPSSSRVIFKTWLRLAEASFVWIRLRTFSCKWEAEEFTLKVTYCGMDCLFTGSFVFRRQVRPWPEPQRFWGLSSAVSAQSFRRPALTRINAIFTSITNHHLNTERGTRVCMNDKLLSWTCLLWVKAYPSDVSIMDIMVYSVVFCWLALPQLLFALSCVCLWQNPWLLG